MAHTNDLKKNITNATVLKYDPFWLKTKTARVEVAKLPREKNNEMGGAHHIRHCLLGETKRRGFHTRVVIMTRCTLSCQYRIPFTLSLANIEPTLRPINLQVNKQKCSQRGPASQGYSDTKTRYEINHRLLGLSKNPEGGGWAGVGLGIRRSTTNILRIEYRSVGGAQLHRVASRPHKRRTLHCFGSLEGDNR